MFWYSMVHAARFRPSFIALIYVATAMIVTTTAAWSYTSNTDWAGANWTLSDGDVVAGVHTNVGHLSIPLGATVTVMNYDPDTGDFGTVAIFADSADIKGTFDANEAGFTAQLGTGAGTGRAGGGYGGRGSTGDSGIGGDRYGSVTEPIDMGSGGSFSNTGRTPGYGGGAIRLWVAGALVLDGTVSANGGDAVSSWTGGGSGGSIWLTADTLSGAGWVTADGGNGTSAGGGGGGGRIAFTTPNNLFSGTLRARGGTGHRIRAGHGTFNFMDHYGSSDDLVIKADIALPPATNWEFRSISVESGATLDIQSTTDIVSRITVDENVVVASGARMAADGQGFPALGGDGAGIGRGGASYGGRGSQGSGSGVAADPFGSINEPDQLGSGGAEIDRGGFGGGVVILDAGGHVAIDGVISADGWPPVHSYGGSGSGGSVWITADRIEGEGTVQANGGPRASSGGGAGGRIAFTTPDNRFDGTLQASGTQGSANRAGHGTFNFMDHYGINDDLVIKGDIALPPATNWEFKSLTVTGGATLEIQSTTDIVSRLNIANDVSIAAGAGISADGMGFPNMTGDGAPLDRGGGSYGGIGSGGNSGAGGPRYGSVSNPDQLGSGGGNTGRGGHGGGVVLLDMGGTMTLNGTISANGWNFEGSWAGGGSGGSIRIEAASIQGTGLVQADGGNASSSGGGGGGGRIAFLTADNQFEGIIQASGGMGHTDRAGNGTFNFADFLEPEDDLLITGDIALFPSNAWTFANLTITNNARLDIQSEPDEIVSRLYIPGNVLIAHGAMLSADAMGYHGEEGPEHGTRRGGGGYGGAGGYGGENPDHSGGIYGVTNAPIDLGSGGGNQTDSHNAIAGGAIILDVGQTLMLNGVISASAWHVTGSWNGAGSGGSIWIIATAFEGEGELRADGGNGPQGGGGGGRIAIWHGPMHPYDKARALDGQIFDRLRVVEVQPETFTGNIWARGGTGSQGNGEDGTVRFLFVEPPTPGTLIMVR